MTDWPGPELLAVYEPTRPTARPESSDGARERIAIARAREGLAVTDRLVAQVIAANDRAGGEQTDIFTAQERADIFGDQERVELAHVVLGGPEVSEIEVFWRDGRRAVRIWLTAAERERHEPQLIAALGADRVVVATARFSEHELEDQQERLAADDGWLVGQGIYLSGSSPRPEGLEIEYFAADFEAAGRLLKDRYGPFVTLRYQGASNRKLLPHPFGSWLAEADQLHVFYALGLNGEQPGGCVCVELGDSVLVSLLILDTASFKTLVGGFTPSHATMRLQRPLGERTVIDNSENRARPHWTTAAGTDLPRPQDL